MAMAPMIAVKTASGWIRQASEALKALELQAPPHTPFIELADIDYQRFCLLVEALHALGQPMEQAVLDRAQMRPVDEIQDKITEWK